MEAASVWIEIEQLRRATVRELRAKYFDLFGEPSRSNHKQFLFRRVAWRLQALAYGELSEQARQQVELPTVGAGQWSAWRRPLFPTVLLWAAQEAAAGDRRSVCATRSRRS